jgi:glycosyltransferase involved in cell wall biosynthesis
MPVSPLNFSVVVPSYNSENTLEELCLRIKKTFEENHKTFEIIFVDDCSQDKTWEKIGELKSRMPEIIVGLKLARNFGQHNATLCGLRHARGSLVITIDDDLQIPPEEIFKLWTEQEKSQVDLVYGNYSAKKHGLIQNFGSSILNKLGQTAFKSKVEGSSFRLLTLDLVQKISQFSYSPIHLDGLIFWHTQSASEVKVEHQDRRSGHSGYNLFKLMQLAFRFIFDFTTAPLTFLIIIGLSLSFVSFVIGSFYFIRKFIFFTPMGYTSVITSIFFSTGVIVFSLGILGAYLRRLLHMISQQPQYSVQKKI